MNLHPYLIFDFEMKAMRNFAAELARINRAYVNPDQEFFTFMDKLISTDSWQHFHFDQTATRKELWKYLHSLGLNATKIREVTGGSPNQISEFIKEENTNIYHYPYNEHTEILIRLWKPYRNLLPNEFFIKYLK